MHIAIDTSAFRLTRAGVAVYLRELLNALRATAPQHTYTEIDGPAWFGRTHRFGAKIDTLYRDLIWRNRSLPRRLLRTGADVFHAPQARGVLTPTIPMVVTFHDCYGLHHPEGFSKWTGYYQKTFLPTLLQRARVIIAVSDFTRREILHFFPRTDDRKIVVIYHGVAKHFRPASADHREAMARRYTLPARFFLAVNTLEPRKNLPRLIEAYRSIAADVEEDLVLVGSPGWIPKHLRLVMQTIARTPRVHYLGYVDSQDLPGLYSSASAYVFPSFYEGFGLPALEAMSCACPVLASEGSSLDEVIGDAGLRFDPGDTAAIAAALRRLAGSVLLREDLIARGLQRASSFTWSRTAQQTLSAYELASLS